jgi:hypothetical protein
MVSTDGPNPSGERDVIDFVSQITGSARLRVEENLPHGFVRLKVAEAERRQAQHDIRSVEDIVTEMVRNSRDAGAKHILVAFQKEQGRYRKLTVIDDGCGIPEDMHRLVFEPRVTSKSEDFEEDRYGVHGRGMALFSIRSRAISAEIVSSSPGVGTAMSVTADTKKVPERSDQATLPRIESTDSGREVGSGPHNVARVLLEMSVDCDDVDFYLGSFAEVLATARLLQTEAGREDFPWNVLASVDDARVLADLAQQVLGLPVSERNAYRVLNDEIATLDTVLSQAQIMTGAPPKEGLRAPGTRGTRGVRTRSPLRKLSREDLSEMGEGCAKVVEDVMSRYYLKSTGAPRVRRGRGKIMMSFFVAEEEGENE